MVNSSLQWGAGRWWLGSHACAELRGIADLMLVKMLCLPIISKLAAIYLLQVAVIPVTGLLIYFYEHSLIVAFLCLANVFIPRITHKRSMTYML